MYNIEVRGEKPFTDVFHGKMATMDTLYQLIKQPIDYMEMIVLPGYLDGRLIDVNPYREMRMVEHSLLTSDYLKNLIINEGTELVS